MSQTHTVDHGHPSVSVYVAVFAALLVLLAVTVAAAEIDLGMANFPVAAAIATIKALLILLFFMHVRYSPALIWLVVGGCAFFLGIMFVLTLSDYVSRGWILIQ